MRSLVLLALLLAIGPGNADVIGRVHAADPDMASPTPVTVALVESRDVPIWLSAIGSVQPLNMVAVKARVDGQLDSVAFTEGQEVRQGDVIAQIDPRMYQAAVGQAAAKLAQDAANLANARIDLARTQKLAASAFASAQQADTQKATVAQLEAQSQQDQASLAIAKLQLDFTTIRAPLDGRTGMRQVDPGSIVHASDPNGLATITQMAPVGAQFSLPQDDLPDIRAAMAGDNVLVEAYSRDNSKLLADGRLVFIDSMVDQASGQIRLKAEFANTDRALWPGQFITARVLVRTIPHAIVVPSNAIEHSEDGLYMFRVEPDNTVAVQPVSVGASVGSLAVVTSGASPGERVVIGGQYRLRAGMRVAPHPMRTSAASQ